VDKATKRKGMILFLFSKDETIVDDSLQVGFVDTLEGGDMFTSNTGSMLKSQLWQFLLS
jgi:hypothetical protein